MSQTPYYASSGYDTTNQPIVVQGQAVHQGSNTAQQFAPVNGGQYDAYKASLYENQAAIEPNGWKKGGETQPRRCNDVIWAVLFFCNLGIMAFVAATYVPQMYAILESEYGNYSGDGGRRRLDDAEEGGEDGEEQQQDDNNNGGEEEAANDDGNNNNNYDNGNGEMADINVNSVIILILTSALFTLIVSSLALSFMMRFAEGLIKSALIFNIITTGIMAVLGFLSGQIMAGVMGLLFFGFTCYYAYVVWSRIPFAACNMTTAVSAIKSNFGVTFFGYASLFVLLGWNIWFAVAFTAYAVVKQQDVQDQQDGEEYQMAMNGVVVFLFLVSYYWTHQVVKNHLQVTVAGTVGTWWFAPAEASSLCSSAVRNSFVRASTWSFGSICFGSLIVAIIQAVKEMVHQARESGDNPILMCIAECILGCIESMAEYFNKWAYVYVGLYGYSFIEAGKNVITLFQERGWTSIITDNLIDRVLFMMSVVIGFIMGLLSVVISMALGLEFPQEAGGPLIAFVVGFMIGLVLSSVIMNVVGSAVNTVIVCYAEAPAEFQMNHPQRSTEMREAWKQAWPAEFKY